MDVKEFEDDFLESKKEQKAARKIASRLDRSKFKKTNLEKRQKRLLKEAQKRLLKKDLVRGRVLAISPEGITVEHEGKFYLCVLRGTLKQEATQAKNLVAVGDFVLFAVDSAKEGSIAYVEGETLRFIKARTFAEEAKAAAGCKYRSSFDHCLGG